MIAACPLDVCMYSAHIITGARSVRFFLGGAAESRKREQCEFWGRKISLFHEVMVCIQETLCHRNGFGDKDGEARVAESDLFFFLAAAVPPTFDGVDHFLCMASRVV